MEDEKRITSGPLVCAIKANWFWMCRIRGKERTEKEEEKKKGLVIYAIDIIV